MEDVTLNAVFLKARPTAAFSAVIRGAPSVGLRDSLSGDPSSPRLRFMRLGIGRGWRLLAVLAAALTCMMLATPRIATAAAAGGRSHAQTAAAGGRALAPP